MRSADTSSMFRDLLRPSAAALSSATTGSVPGGVPWPSLPGWSSAVKFMGAVRFSNSRFVASEGAGNASWQFRRVWREDAEERKVPIRATAVAERAWGEVSRLNIERHDLDSLHG